jgi:hypothetical protein
LSCGAGDTSSGPAAEVRGLDCLILCGWPAMWDFNIANARYLCPIGGNAEFNVLVFPRAGEPTSFIYSPVFTDYCRGAQSWVSDARPKRGTFGDSVADRLAELGLTGAKIGIDGLAGPLDPDGWVPHSMYARLQERLPKVHPRQSRRHDGEVAHRQKRRGDRDSGKSRRARRSHAAGVPRHRAPQRQGVLKSKRNLGLAQHLHGSARQPEVFALEHVEDLGQARILIAAHGGINHVVGNDARLIVMISDTE